MQRRAAKRFQFFLLLPIRLPSTLIRHPPPAQFLREACSFYTEAPMNRRFASLILPLALAIPLGAFTLQAAPAQAQASKVAPAAAASQAEGGDASDAQALRVAELKLLALAKEAKSADAPGAAATPKLVEKKHPLKKKRASKSHRRLAQAKADENGKVPKILGRRLTQSEVQGILTTTRDFTGSDLSGLNLAGADLSGVKFNRANLKMANLERADLAETDLELADLTGANLRGASLNQARLRGTKMEGVKMDGTLWVDRTICKKGSVGSCLE
jgi:hypothetical protein